MNKIPSVEDILAMTAHDKAMLRRICLQSLLTVAKCLELLNELREKDMEINNSNLAQENNTLFLTTSISILYANHDDMIRSICRDAAQLYRGAHFFYLKLEEIGANVVVRVTDERGYVVHSVKATLATLMFASAFDLLYEIQPYDERKLKNWRSISNYVKKVIGEDEFADFGYFVNSFAETREGYLQSLLDSFTKKHIYFKDADFSAKIESLLYDAGFDDVAKQIYPFCEGKRDTVKFEHCTVNFNDIHDNSQVTLK